MQNIHFSDEELVAYLDGEADFAPMTEIETALKTDVVLAKRLERLRIDTQTIADGFDEIVTLAGSPPDLAVKSVSARSYRNVAAAAMIALFFGFSAGYVSFKSEQPGWKDYVAAYHALYTNGTLNHVRVSTFDQQQELNRVATAIGKSLQVSSLSGYKEIEYKRAQILGYEGKALIQLAFLSSLGEPIALCIVRSDDSDTASVELEELEGMSAASWTKDGYEYILIGGTDRSLISRMATAFAKRLG